MRRAGSVFLKTRHAAKCQNHQSPVSGFVSANMQKMCQALAPAGVFCIWFSNERTFRTFIEFFRIKCKNIENGPFLLKVFAFGAPEGMIINN